MRNRCAILIVIVAIAFGLRLINLSWGLSTSPPGQSYYPDEPEGYQSAFNIQPFYGKLDPGNWSLIKGTFYYQTVGFLNNMLEITHIKTFLSPHLSPNNPEIYLVNYGLGRSVSLFFSLTTIILLFYFGSHIFHQPIIGLLAAFNYAIFAQEIVFANLMTGDTLVTFLILLSVYLCLEAQHQNSLEKLHWAAFIGGLAAATKYTAFSTLLPILLTFYFLRLNYPRLQQWTFINLSTTGILNNKPKLKQTLIRLMSLLLIFGTGFVLGEPAVFFKFSHFLTGLAIQNNYQITTPFLPGENQFPQFIFYLVNVLPQGIGVGFVVLSLTAIFYFLKTETRLTVKIIVLSWIAVYLGMLSSVNWVTTRYTLPLLPFLAILMGYFLYYLYQKLKYRRVILTASIVIYTYQILFLFNFIDAIHQPLVQRQFADYEHASLNLSREKSEITFILPNWPDKSTYPVDHEYSVATLTLDQIKSNPQIDVLTRYILISDNQFRDFRRVGDRTMIQFLDRLQYSDEFKLIKIFEKDYKIPFLIENNLYRTVDLEIFFHKMYLYENQINLP